ncbi:erythromycin esterase family protein [Phenylobacterium sp.]|jgi:erythromycin esterase-like protein|uniref:erythromycin esterase family protein n=1 Tax=Phenylobacterium sp. TaxID=1871053 RepID=UPI002F91FC58
MPPSERRRLTLACALAAALAVADGALAGPPSPITGGEADYRPLVDAARGSTFVLLGESTHGTREFYRERARITEQLIRAGAVRAIAIEGDWSGAERLNRYLRGQGEDRTAEAALSGFDEFPTWMWRNAEFRDFVERVRAINLARPAEQRVGIYGLDVYDFFDAADAVTARLATLEPATAQRVRSHYGCFGRFRRSADRYSEAVRGGRTCRRQAEQALAEVERIAPVLADEEARFALRRAAATVVAGEEYFRIQQATGYSWNARDRRMAQAAAEIARHAGGGVAIWAHNTHVGDARHTSQRQQGDVTLGQLLRERGGAFLVGFLTYEGEVTAAELWGGKPRTFAVPPAAPESHEARLHTEGPADALRLLRGEPARPRARERAIGVIFNPRRERQSHYIDAVLEQQFDTVVFLDRTRAVTPLPR